MPERLVVATRNEGKLREIAELLKGLAVEVVSLADFPDAPEVEEPHDTFCANACEKALAIAAATGHWAVADDSGLEVDALDGEPGVKSARVAETDPERIAWLLQRLSGIAPEDRRARFVCCIALASPEGILGTWQETVEGLISDAPEGDNGFGFDPVFIYPPAGRTFARLSREEKSAVSHRGKALRAFRQDFEAVLAERGR